VRCCYFLSDAIDTMHQMVVLATNILVCRDDNHRRKAAGRVLFSRTEQQDGERRSRVLLDTRQRPSQDVDGRPGQMSSARLH
jgi:hypothetical protein